MGFALDEHTDEDDLFFESHDIKIVYKKEFEPYFKGLALDYSDKWYRKGYTFIHE